MTKIVHPDETLNIYYRVSEDTKDIEHISVSGEEDDISKLNNIQNIQKIQWSPDENKHNGKTFEFDIDGFGTEEIKVADISDNIIDNFEYKYTVKDATKPFGIYESDFDLSDFYTGDLGNFERTKERSITGDYSCKVDRNNDETAIISRPEDNNSDLPKYPEAGDKFSVWSYVESNDDWGLYHCFGVQSSVENNDVHESYAVAFRFNNNTLHIKKN